MTKYRHSISVSVVFGLTAISSGRLTAQEEKPDLQETLRRVASHYDVESAFRFDPPRARTKEPIFHQPEAMGFALERRLSALPRSGRAKQTPWPGYWWPMSKDGTAARPDATTSSPIEKYDRAFGTGTEAAEWECRYHGTRGDQKPAEWWGHCNGWAAAALMEPEPTRAVELHGVRFEPSDVKALLTEVYFGCHAVGVDRRYCGRDEIAVDEHGRPVDAAFRDVNPAVLHLLATNLIGNEGRAIVADVAPGDQVWNYPLTSFKVEQLDDLGEDGAKAVQRITGRPFAGPYPFNDDSRRFAFVRLRLERVDVLSRPSAPGAGAVVPNLRHLLLEYVLELDANGRLIGGEWARDSRTEHPDFLWVPLSPASSYTVTPDGRRVVGTSGRGNPFIVYEEVRQLVALSVGEALQPSIASAADTPTPESLTAPEASMTGPERWDRPDGCVDAEVVRTFQRAQAAIRQGTLSDATQILTTQLDRSAGAAQQTETAPTPSPISAELVAELRLRRGWLRYLQGRTSQALEDYRRIPTEGPLGPTVLARRSLMRTASGDVLRGLLDATEAIRRNDGNPWWYLARAWVYQTRNGPEDAKRAAADVAMARALGSDPLILFTSQTVVGQEPMNPVQNANGVSRVTSPIVAPFHNVRTSPRSNTQRR